MAKSKLHIKYVYVDEAYPVYGFTSSTYGIKSLFTAKELKFIEKAEADYERAQALLSRTSDALSEKANNLEKTRIEKRHKMVLRGQIPDEEVL